MSSFEDYVQLVADALDLQGWTFVLRKGARHDHYASCRVENKQQPLRSPSVIAYCIP